MPPTRTRIITLFIFFLVLLLSTASLSSSATSPTTACKSTPHPKLCRRMLSVTTSSPFNYTALSIKQSLNHAQRLSALISTVSRRLSHPHLSDCALLFELNVDYLCRITDELGPGGLTFELSSAESVGRVKALLSAVVTNQQTCYDGMREKGGWSEEVASVLHAPVVNGSEVYGVALGLVTHALGRTIMSHWSGLGRVLSQSEMSWESSLKVFKALENNLQMTQEQSIGGIKRRLLGEMASNGIIVKDAVVVSPYGDGDFTTINQAIAIAPNDSEVEDGYFIIYIKQGYYEEYVTVSKHKKGVMLLGDGINRTVIAGNRSVVDGWTTFSSATFAVSGERFVAIGITFKNTAGPENQQAVAVRNNADLSSFFQCSFIGYQDTLYVHSMRQFYRECDIYGTVDIIFGNSASVFQTCNLYALKPLPNQKNSFTAQGRSHPNQTTGISIHNCTIRAAPDLAMDPNRTAFLSYLGRPWHNYSRVVYMQSYIGDVVDPVGWLTWNRTIGLERVFYGEFENYGPGSETRFRAPWPGCKVMDVNEALNFTVYNFTMGDTWLPYANIPFEAGLL